MLGRWWIALVLALVGCDAPRVVDCTSSGRFLEAGGDHWCLYPRTATERCPRLLPVEHMLPWGGRGCASREHAPLPPELCAAAGTCADAGGP